jgi:signal transduction histidine kinase
LFDPIGKPIDQKDAAGFPLLGSGVPFSIYADKQAIRRVLMNLFDNAFKFSRIQTDVIIRSNYEDNKLVMEIEDHGDGISASELPQLFCRFSQTAHGRKYHAGTGLGLYLCRQVVEAHGGEISCFSEVGIGTTFRFTLPKADFLRH